MPRLISMAKTVPQVIARAKTVTRRDGWLFAVPGDVYEMVEWSTRVGQAQACGCGKAPVVPLKFCTTCGMGYVLRDPRRLGKIRVLSVRREPLREITDFDIDREGFPGLDRDGFIHLYCNGAPDPERVVTRVEFEYLEDGK